MGNETATTQEGSREVGVGILLIADHGLKRETNGRQVEERCDTWGGGSRLLAIPNI